MLLLCFHYRFDFDNSQILKYSSLPERKMLNIISVYIDSSFCQICFKEKDQLVTENSKKESLRLKTNIH